MKTNQTHLPSGFKVLVSQEIVTWMLMNSGGLDPELGHQKNKQIENVLLLNSLKIHSSVATYISKFLVQ